MRNLLLNLDKALKGRSTKPSDCLSSSTKQVVFIDDSKAERKCVFVVQNEYEDIIDIPYFKINNASAKEIILWSIDGCFVKEGKALSSSYSQKCDCAFGCDEYFAFLEIKMEATSSDPDMIQRNRTKAVEQIKDTIGFIKDSLNLPDIRDTGHLFEAFVCTPFHYPKMNTAMTTLAIGFLETYGFQLHEASYKKID